MEEAITEAVNSTVATFVDKAVTRAMENAFNEAVEREVQERVHAIEGHFAAAVDKAVEERVKVIEETMHKKNKRSSRIEVLRAETVLIRRMLHERQNTSMETSITYSLRSSLIRLSIEDCMTMSRLLKELEELEAEDKEQL